MTEISLSNRISDSAINSAFEYSFVTDSSASLITYSLRDVMKSYSHKNLKRITRVACSTQYVFVGHDDGKISVLDYNGDIIQIIQCHCQSISALKCNEFNVFSLSLDGSLCMFGINASAVAHSSKENLKTSLVSKAYIDKIDRNIENFHLQVSI